MALGLGNGHTLGTGGSGGSFQNFKHNSCSTFINFHIEINSAVVIFRLSVLLGLKKMVRI